MMKQYIIFDLEATCWERSKQNNRTSEIIEIGAVKLDEKVHRIDTFQTFVKPLKNPVLSDFCIELTSIMQSDIDTAPYFPEAINDFENWICSNNEESILLSWGYYDKHQLLRECDDKKYQGVIISLLENHNSLKYNFAAIRGVKACGMKKALRILNIPLEGTHHRGIDDALNISKIFKAVFEEWNFID